MPNVRMQHVFIMRTKSFVISATAYLAYFFNWLFSKSGFKGLVVISVGDWQTRLSQTHPALQSMQQQSCCGGIIPSPTHLK